MRCPSVCLAILTTCAFAILAPTHAQPLMSRIETLDHGLPYHDDEDDNFGCAIGLRNGDLALTFNTGRLSVYRRGLLGEERVLVPTRIWAGTAAIGAYDLAPVSDGTGWKMARTDGNPPDCGRRRSRR